MLSYFGEAFVDDGLDGILGLELTQAAANFRSEIVSVFCASGVDQAVVIDCGGGGSVLWEVFHEVIDILLPEHCFETGCEISHSVEGLQELDVHVGRENLVDGACAYEIAG